ncbi:thiaminase II [Curvivirga sp.]|uniref:thiaminase II n=1 Tax=Curvivirga sp. TaxID=2856848 RepID=UPI003B59C726
MGLFQRLKESCPDDWAAYTHHDFVEQLGKGSLPKECFQHYLKQDYIFLIHFARCHALAAYKSTKLSDIKRAQEGVSAIVDMELGLHLKYCAEWGIHEDELDDLEESTANMAYTRYVMECGMSGGLLELYVALAPCAIGYAEIGRRLASEQLTPNNNPYADWVEMYSGKEYLAAVDDMITYLDELAGDHLSKDREAELAKIFRNATRLEVGFWQMGLDLS